MKRLYPVARASQPTKKLAASELEKGAIKRLYGKSDKIPGGLAEGKKTSDFPKSKIKQGKEVEMEHTSDPRVAEEIAMDHLTEDPNYYKKLKTIEKSSWDTQAAKKFLEQHQQHMPKMGFGKMTVVGSVREKGASDNDLDVHIESDEYDSDFESLYNHFSSHGYHVDPESIYKDEFGNQHGMFSLTHPKTGHAIDLFFGKLKKSEFRKPKTLTPQKTNPKDPVMEYGKIPQSKAVKRSDDFYRRAMRYLENKNAIKKAKEEEGLDPDSKKTIRQERQAFSKDPYVSQLTSKPGVSDRGIEARRADIKAKGTIAHGYARVSDVGFHQKRASNYFKRMLASVKEMPKPNLPKSELAKNGQPLPGAFKQKIGPRTVLRNWSMKHDKENNMIHFQHPEKGSITIRPNPKQSRKQFPYEAVHNGAHIGKYPTPKHAALGVANYIRSLGLGKETRMLNVDPNQPTEKFEFGGGASNPSGVSHTSQTTYRPSMPMPVTDPQKARSFAQGFQSGGPSLGEMYQNLKAAFTKSERVDSLMSHNPDHIRQVLANKNIPPSVKLLMAYGHKLARELFPEAMSKSVKYLSVSQTWPAKRLNPKTNAYEHPMQGKSKLTHLKDLESLKNFHNWSDKSGTYMFHDKPQKIPGMETYKVHPSGELEFSHAHYDTSD